MSKSQGTIPARSIRVDDPTWLAALAATADNGTTVTEVVRAALADYAAAHAAAPTASAVPAAPAMVEFVKRGPGHYATIDGGWEVIREGRGWGRNPKATVWRTYRDGRVVGESSHLAVAQQDVRAAIEGGQW